ncbi:MAG: alpha/beta hydrolase [Acidobacteriota bacterium]
MRRTIVAFLSLTLLGNVAYAAPKKPTGANQPVAYGSNPKAGKTFTHDGVQLYYEVYGTGEPVLLIHGNGASIAAMKFQIEYFRKRYKVIAMDSRDHGKSGSSPDPITYEKMTDDLAALLDHLQTGPVNVIGWSDGGIEALLLGIRHPAQVKKLASMAANLVPNGLHPDTLKFIHATLDAMPPAAQQTAEQKREVKVTTMMLSEPQIPLGALEAITAPTLVLAGDHDAILDEHTLDIYHHLPNSQLCIFPDATHGIPVDNPALFNSTVDRFFRTRFVKKDRIQDLLKTLETLKAPEKH